jgi:hypothetical protein
MTDEEFDNLVKECEIRDQEEITNQAILYNKSVYSKLSWPLLVFTGAFFVALWIGLRR